MLPLSPRRPVPFRPREDGPVYLVKPADLYERAAFRRAVAQKGARFPGDAELFAALRAGVEALAPEDQREGLVAVVAGAEALLAAGTPLDEAAAADFASIAQTVRGAGGLYAALEAERGYWLDVAPLIAAEMFLVGIEGEDPLPRKGGVLVPGALDHGALAGVEERDLARIGFEALRLMNLSGDDAKNSPSGSRSASSPIASTETVRTAGTSPAPGTTTRTRRAR